VELGTSSGAIRRVTLKRFLDETGSQPLEISSNLNLLHLRFGQDKIEWRLLNHSETSATFEASSSTNNYHITYAINTHNPIIDIVLTHIQNSDKSTEYLAINSTWLRLDKLNGQRNPLELVVLEEVSNKRKHKQYNGPIKQEKIVPRGTFLLSLAERYFCQSIKAELAPGEVTLLPSPDGTVAAEMRIPLDQLKPGSAMTVARAYFGARDYFQLQRAGLSDAFPIGILGQIGLILLTALSFVAGITKNYGVAIILFSAAITCAVAPFTVLSLKSMKKMQELKPQIDRLMAQHKSDPTRANKEVFGLYKQHRVSPMSGCLPMLLQMPIFIAMFQAISHFIELRGRSFLWIKDLSLPDRLAHLPFSIPLIGNEFNLLPIIMAAVMYVQSRMSQVTTAQAQSNPAMKMMSGPTMSIVFGFMFYQFPSGLVLYWLTNSVTSLAWYRMAK
jgi:YidC/Oxa1 family membrane protein insertase